MAQATPQRAESVPGLGTQPVKSQEMLDEEKQDSDEEWINRRVPTQNHEVAKKPRPSSAPPNSPPYYYDGPEFTSSELKRYAVLPDRQPDCPSERSETPVQDKHDGKQANKAPVLSDNGTMHVPEPMEPFEDTLEIPDIQDALAPKFRVGEHHLSPEAIRSRARRIFTPRSDGSKKVSDEIWSDWRSKGSKRKLLEDIFKRCGYDPETCLDLALVCILFENAVVIKVILISLPFTSTCQRALSILQMSKLRKLSFAKSK